MPGGGYGPKKQPTLEALRQLRAFNESPRGQLLTGVDAPQGYEGVLKPAHLLEAAVIVQDDEGAARHLLHGYVEYLEEGGREARTVQENLGESWKGDAVDVAEAMLAKALTDERVVTTIQERLGVEVKLLAPEAGGAPSSLGVLRKVINDTRVERARQAQTQD